MLQHVTTSRQAMQVHLDLRIAEERMIALTPPCEAPDWLWQVLGGSAVPHAFVMDATGTVAPRRILLDEINWTSAVAVRLETAWGDPIDLEALDDDEDWY